MPVIRLLAVVGGSFALMSECYVDTCRLGRCVARGGRWHGAAEANDCPGPLYSVVKDPLRCCRTNRRGSGSHKQPRPGVCQRAGDLGSEKPSAASYQPSALGPSALSLRPMVLLRPPRVGHGSGQRGAGLCKALRAAEPSRLARALRERGISRGQGAEWSRGRGGSVHGCAGLVGCGGDWRGGFRI